jgi:hypothetical protein
MAKNNDFITLKEAAKISGYSADYLGQLIRSGKLPGKQVFSNVSWVTTEDALIEYMKSGGKVSGASTQSAGRFSWSNILSDESKLIQMYRIATWILGGLLLIAVLFLTYIAIVTFDKSIDQKFLEEATNDA